MSSSVLSSSGYLIKSVATFCVFVGVLFPTLTSTAYANAKQNLTIHQVDPTTWVQECASVFQETCCQLNRGNESYYVNYSSYDIIKKPSGLCKPEFSCAYSKCIPTNYQSPTGSSTNDKIDTFVTDFLTGIDLISDTTTYSDVESVLGPGLNLPEKIAFPTNPNDIVEAIQHAKEEGLTVSIMTSGHSYIGASTSAQSLQLNLREYPKYSKISGIVECDDSDSDDNVVVIDNDDNTAACKLAIARGKKALIRVGGGEIFNDVANSVYAVKDDNTTYSKYMMLHGVGTVGAAGGWLQGGGLGWGQERVWGLGVDQVLEIEMVLADETHVKFYPTEWEDSEGFLYPKTTKVDGLCSTNNILDEEEENNEELTMMWGPCEDPVPPFEDLWFAVRGGGGGTYGVVESVKIQLHENIPFYVFTANATIMNENEALLMNLTEDEKNDIKGVVGYCRMTFIFDFLYSPEKINVSRDDSNGCGTPVLIPTLPIMTCLGESAVNAIKTAYDESIMSCVGEILPEYLEYGPDLAGEFEIVGPFDSILGFANTDEGLQKDVPGQLTDDGPSILPQYRPFGGWCSAQVPVSWLAGRSDDEETDNLVIETFLINNAFASHVTGGNVATAHDQMNAVPVPERQSGLASSVFGSLPTDLQEQLLKVFLNETITNGDSFPGISEYNHICSDSYGPLKSNMTKLCPKDYTTEEKDEMCYSMQESVWGIELTAKLEDIKYKVDPDHLFYCYGCIKPRSSNSSSSSGSVDDNVMPSDSSLLPVEAPDDESASSDEPLLTPTTATTSVPVTTTATPATDESSSSSLLFRQYDITTITIAIAISILFVIGGGGSY